MKDIFKRIEWCEELLNDIRNCVNDDLLKTSLRRAMNLTEYANWLTECILNELERREI